MRELTSIDEHVLSTELEERSDVLEDEPERVGLPVVCIIGEQDAALNVCVQQWLAVGLVNGQPFAVSAMCLAEAWMHVICVIPMSICFRNVQSIAVPMM